MADYSSRLILRLVDHVSAPARKIGGALGTLGGAIAGTSGRKNVGALNSLGREMRRVGYLSRDVASSLSLPAAGATWFGAKAVYDFEKMGNAMQAVGRLTDKQREKIEAYSQALNEKFPFKNAEILSAAFELGRAGQNFEQIMGSLKSTLNVALAGDMQLQQTADIMTNVAQAMRLPIETAEQTEKSMIRVGDALAYAATRSNTDIAKMGVTFKYAAPIFAAAGLSLEQMAAMTMILANNGIKGSDAGTGLRFALMSLLKPSKEAQKALNLLNIDLGKYIKGAKAIDRKTLYEQLSLDGIDLGDLGVDSLIDDALNDKNINKSAAKLAARIGDIVSEALGDSSVVDMKALTDSLVENLSVLGTQVDLFGLLTDMRKKPNAEATPDHLRKTARCQDHVTDGWGFRWCLPEDAAGDAGICRRNVPDQDERRCW